LAHGRHHFPQMLIPAHRLHRYLPNIQFPIEMRSEDGRRILAPVENEKQFTALAAACVVIGVGNKNRLRYLQANTLSETARKHVLGDSVEEEPDDDGSVERGDRKYTYREHLEIGFIHMLKRFNPKTGSFMRWPEN
jgi:hypothetical protein